MIDAICRKVEEEAVAYFEIKENSTEHINALAQVAYDRDWRLVEIAHGVVYEWKPVQKRCSNYPRAGFYLLVDYERVKVDFSDE